MSKSQNDYDFLGDEINVLIHKTRTAYIDNCTGKYYAHREQYNRAVQQAVNLFDRKFPILYDRMISKWKMRDAPTTERCVEFVAFLEQIRASEHDVFSPVDEDGKHVAAHKTLYAMNHANFECDPEAPYLFAHIQELVREGRAKFNKILEAQQPWHPSEPVTQAPTRPAIANGNIIAVDFANKKRLTL